MEVAAAQLAPRSAEADVQEADAREPLAAMECALPGVDARVMATSAVASSASMTAASVRGG